MPNLPSPIIALFLFLVLLLANELGFRIGRARSRRSDEGARTQTNGIQASMLGLLALLLGFSFSMASGRYDQRSAAVVDEANAIGTAWLRTELLMEPAQGDARAILAEYVRTRAGSARLDLSRREERLDSLRRATEIHTRLWHVAVQATELDPRPATSGLFVQATNQLIDSYGSRDSALRRHVPPVVLWLLFSAFVVAGATLGYAGGLAGSRPLVATIAMLLLLSLVIGLTIDLDRPRRGLVQVDQSALHDLVEVMGPPGR